MPHDDRAMFEEMFEERGIDQVHWDDLIAVIESGELTDADNGTDPVTIETVVRDGEVAERLVFPDHSVAFRAPELDPTDVEVLGASAHGESAQPLGSGTAGCLTKIGSVWITVSGCKPYYDGLSFAYHFYVTFKVRSGYNSHITYTSSPTISRAYLHTASNAESYIAIARGSSSSPARASMRFDLSNNVTGSLRKIYLNFYLTNGASTWATTNL